MGNTVELTTIKYAELIKCSRQNVTKKIRNGGILKGVVEIKKIGRDYVLVVDKSLL